MKNLFLTLFCISSMLFTQAQDCGPINTSQLKSTLEQMGYAVKNTNEAGKQDKFEIKTSNGGLDIPIGLEISASTNYIWLTVFLGKWESGSSISTETLLKQNAIVQPCLFYITAKGNLMMGLPVENRAVTTAVLKRTTDFISNRVSDTKTYWQAQ